MVGDQFTYKVIQITVMIGDQFTHKLIQITVMVGVKVCPGCISETVRCRKLILGRDIG